MNDALTTALASAKKTLTLREYVDLTWRLAEQRDPEFLQATKEELGAWVDREVAHTVSWRGRE